MGKIDFLLNYLKGPCNVTVEKKVCNMYMLCIYLYILYIKLHIIYINRQWAGPEWVRLGQALARPSRFQAFQNWAQSYPVALGQE